MRRAAKVDENQRQIVDTFRKAGATVQHLHNVAGGCPDLLVGYRGVNLCVEVKDGSKPPSERQLTPAQVLWHDGWLGQSCVVDSPEAALALLGVIPVCGKIE